MLLDYSYYLFYDLCMSRYSFSIDAFTTWLKRNKYEFIIIRSTKRKEYV